MSDSAAVLTTCMICFVMRKCRTRYLGKEDQGLVCSGDACRAKHIVRKTEARTASNAEKEAAKVLAREAKAQATAAKSAAARVARAAQGPRAKKKAAASSASFFRDPDDADGLDDEEARGCITSRDGGDGRAGAAVERGAGLLAAGAAQHLRRRHGGRRGWRRRGDRGGGQRDAGIDA